MCFKVVKLTEYYAKEICKWKYDGEYFVYNYPPWNEMLKNKWAITIDEKREKEFIALIDDYKFLCGYIRLVNEEDYIIVGLGLKPSLCGQGIGSSFIKVVKDVCMNLYPMKKIVLEVRLFNKRAIKCYEKANFQVIGVFEKNIRGEKVKLVRMEFRY
ncbi:MAG: GNAT family N-acetyltransferase [Sarcina sp.]